MSTNIYNAVFMTSDGTVLGNINRSRMPRGAIQHYNFDTLSANQQALLKVLQKDPNVAKGRAIKFVCGREGIPYAIRGESGNLGNIVKVAGNPSDPRSLQFTIHLRDDALYTAYLYEFELTVPLKPPTQKELDKLEKERKIKIVDDLVNIFNRKVNQGYDQLQKALTEGEKGIKDSEQMMKDLELRHKKYSKQIKDAKVKIEEGNFKEISLEDMVLSLQEVYKNRNVEQVYITTDYALVVKTKMLHANDSNGPEVGRFTFNIKLVPQTGVDSINVINRDYSCNSYMHPNISGSNGHVCWGSNAKLVSELYNKNQLYQLVDFLMAFFTTFPHEAGSPYIGYDTWLNNRQPHGGSSMLNGSPLIEIPRPTKSFKDLKKAFLSALTQKKGRARVTQVSNGDPLTQRLADLAVADLAELQRQQSEFQRDYPAANPYPGAPYPPLPTNPTDNEQNIPF